MATLLLSYGVPMITAGDEMGRTQRGNNNAYCQDSPLSWVHWDTLEEYGELLELTRTLLAVRAEHPVLRDDHYRDHTDLTDAQGLPLGRVDATWFRFDEHRRLLVGEQQPVAVPLAESAPRLVDVDAEPHHDAAQVGALPRARPGGDRAVADAQ